MPAFGERSMERLATCHPDLQLICNAAIAEGPDFSVICGHRTQAEQDRAVADGLSKAPWPTSRHNSTPSMAVDVAPWPIDWEDIARFRLLQGYLLATADALYAAGRISHRLRSGGDWDRDYVLDDQRFIDLPHFELIPAD